MKNQSASTRCGYRKIALRWLNQNLRRLLALPLVGLADFHEAG
jgi:hypothetical protein